VIRRSLDLIAKVAGRAGECHLLEEFGAVLKEAWSGFRQSRRITEAVAVCLDPGRRHEAGESISTPTSRACPRARKRFTALPPRTTVRPAQPSIAVFRQRGIEVLLLSDRSTNG
jgi:hypothetical protein